MQINISELKSLSNSLIYNNMIEKENIKFQKFVVIVGIILLIAKFLAYFYTNSNSILTDALESIINVLAGVFTLYSLIISSLPKDKNHPYGHGKVEFIAASIEGSLIALAGLIIIGKSFYNFFVPHEIGKLDLGIAITTAAGLVNYLVGVIIETRGKNHHNLALVAGGKHLKSDAYSTAGMIVGLVVIYFTNITALDNVVALIFGFIILITGYKILIKSVGGIMDEADYGTLNQIIVLLNEKRKYNWIDIHNMRIIKYGSNLHIDCHLTLPWYISLEESHQEVTEFEELINIHVPNKVEFFVHTDPCLPTCCKLCQVSECKERKFDFIHRVEWELENVIVDRKHQINDE